MRNEDFFEGLLLALRVKHGGLIETEGNCHHRRFEAVAAQIAANPVWEELRYTFKPNMMGIFQEWDAALVNAQDVLLGAHNPTYPLLSFKLDRSQATELLGSLYPQDKEKLLALADAYTKAEVVQPA